MIALDHVGWTYPHAEAPSLSDIELHVAPGEFVVLCGASGCGKSTLLRLLNGLIPHFHEEGTLSGTVRVDGLDTAAAELDELGWRTGTVLQHPRRQFFADTAPEEIAFAMENFGLAPDHIRARVASIVTELETVLPVGERLQRLSGGQQQQVAIAAARAHRPAVLLLDEPSSNLSTDAVERLVRTLSALKASGVTIVIAEHRLRYLQGLLDRVVVMRDGRVHVEWSAEEFRAIPDEELANEGLRGDVRPAVLPETPAAGSSIAAPAPVAAVRAGAVELRDVRCRLGGRTVLDVELATFQANEVTAIRGVNGTGKSTLARVVAGLQRSSGSIRMDGRETKRRDRQRSTAIVMQDVQRQLFTDSVGAEVDLAAASARETKRERGRDRAHRSSASPSAAASLESLDLAHLTDRHPLSLSGGQQQRLVVAAVNASDRRVVIFDEPSSGVDRRHLRSISDHIRGVAASGAVVLLISHDEDLLALAADVQLTLTPLAPDQHRPA